MSTGSTSSQYYSSVNFLIPQTPPSDIPKEVQAALSQVYLSIQQIIQAFTNNCGISSQPPSQWAQFAGNPNTILRTNLGRFYATASEAIPYGAIVTFSKVAGTLEAQNASAVDNSKPGMAFNNTTNNLVAGQVGEFIMGTGLINIKGLTAGTVYYLSTTKGFITVTKPTSAGNIEQFIGFAVSDTELLTNIQYWIQH